MLILAVPFAVSAKLGVTSMATAIPFAEMASGGHFLLMLSCPCGLKPSWENKVSVG